MMVWGILVLALGVNPVPVKRAAASQPSGATTETVNYGNLIIPVFAPGTVTANELVELKSKASGRVLDICVQEGQMVKAGTVLMRLDPVDEARAVERLQAEVDRVKA